MLDPKIIPDREPQIDIGIILPEDRRDRLVLVLSPGPPFTLTLDDGASFALDADTTVVFHRQSRHLQTTLPGAGDLQAAAWRIVSRQTATSRDLPRNAIIVREVPAGRNFHWQKNIDVALPGELHLTATAQGLLLSNRLPFEIYIASVATSEMSAACPPALLQAQTVAARSWMLANVEQKHRHLGIDVCNDDCCQRYQGISMLTAESLRAAQTTRGEVLRFNGSICDARYAKCCGGMSEAFEAVWSGDPIPYLCARLDAPAEAGPVPHDLTTEAGFRRWLTDYPKTYCSPDVLPESGLTRYLGSVDEQAAYFRWNYALSQEDLTALLNRQLGLEAAWVQALEPRQRGASGRLTRLQVIYFDKAGACRKMTIDGEYRIRQAIHPRFAFSSAVAIDTEPTEHKRPTRFLFYGCGWGHGVGLCQIGALGMALQGFGYRDILRHYYPGSHLTRLYT